MGLKLEILIAVAITAILSVTFMVKFPHKPSNGKIFTKELEFTDTTFTEVNTDTMQGIAFSTHGVREQGELTLYDLIYHTNKIKLFRAKKGTYIGDKIYLDGNITVNKKEGFDYFAQHAVYDKKTEILDITSAFTAIMDKNRINGHTLRYDMQKKEAFGKRIHAVVYTTEK